jgi:hypothetical protein
MENLVQYYIQEAKEGIEVDGEIINLLNKKSGDIIVKKSGLTTQMFAQLTKAVMDYYDSDIAGKKANDFIADLEIKAKFPDSKYVQDITVRSYLCHVLETSKESIDNFYSSNETVKKEAVKDLALNIAIVQLKKIYKINSLKFAKILKKDESAVITTAEIKETKKILETQIKNDVYDVIPEKIKDMVISKDEKIKAIDLRDIKKELQKINVKIDDNAVKNVNKYLFAISETFNFLKLHFPKLTIKNIEASEKMIEKAHEMELKEKDTSKQVFINKIKDILSTLGHINSFTTKENFENMNVLAWSYNVINLKAYHTSVSDFDQITMEIEKKVVSILAKYQPAQRNSYDAYHLTEDFIEICRDQTGDIKISHNVTDLMLIEILKDYMKKEQDQVNTILRVANKFNKTKAIEVKKDEQGVVTQIVNSDKTEKTRRSEVEDIVDKLSTDTLQARKFFFDLYNGATTFNDKTWNNLDEKTKNQIMKNAKINRNSAEFLELKLNKKIEKVVGINPSEREMKKLADGKKEIENKMKDSMTPEAISFIDQFENQKENYRNKYKEKIETMQSIIDQYKSGRKLKKDILLILDKADSFEYKIIDFAKATPAGGIGAIGRIFESTETPILNKYIGMINENR